MRMVSGLPDLRQLCVSSAGAFIAITEEREDVKCNTKSSLIRNPKRGKFAARGELRETYPDLNQYESRLG